VGGGGWLKTLYGGGELAENFRILSYKGEGSKIAQKNRHMIFERFLSVLAYMPNKTHNDLHTDTMAN